MYHRHIIESYYYKIEIGTTFLILFITIFLSLFIIRRVLNPLSALHYAMQSVQKGDLSIRCATNTNDEFGDLSRTFDAMAIDLVTDLRQEISERKRIQDALKESEYFFKESQIAAHIGSYKADFITECWTSSEVLDKIFGIDEHYNRSIQGWLNIVHPDDRDMMGKYLNEYVIEQKKPFSKEYRITRINDGETRWVYGLGELRFDDNGNSAYLIGTIQDITDRKEMEIERTALAEQLLKNQKLESLGVLAGGIAHDFNNILMVIIGNADLSLMRLPPESPIAENLHNIEQAAGRAADLAKQMLAYSGKGKFVITDINLNMLLNEMPNMLEAAISKKAKLCLNLQPDLPSVEADATQMRQMIINLVTNASEALDNNNGIITITTGSMECEKSYLKESWLDDDIPEGLYVYLEVSDTGVGMDRQTVNKIFDPFFTTKFTGRGLGMAAVLGIIRGHKGIIKIDSEVDKGSVVRVLLPASNSPHKLHEIMDIQFVSNIGGMVLLVDDEEYIRGVGSEMLRELGFDVVTAIDGIDALEKFKANPNISFVVLDLSMPNMDGEACFRELRQIKTDVKVLMSSGYNEQEVTQKFIGKELAGFIQKPYKLSVLQEAIAKITP